MATNDNDDDDEGRTTMRKAPPTAAMSNCSWGGNGVQFVLFWVTTGTPPSLTANASRGGQGGDFSYILV